MLMLKIDFNFMFLDGIPMKMKLSLSGEAQEQFGAKISRGIYFLQENTTNGKPFWIHQSGDKAIWWLSDKWIVTPLEEINKWYLGYLNGPSGVHKFPCQITNGWQDLTDDGLQNISGIHFEDITFKPSKLLWKYLKSNHTNWFFHITNSHFILRPKQKSSYFENDSLGVPKGSHTGYLGLPTLVRPYTYQNCLR